MKKYLFLSLSFVYCMGLSGITGETGDSFKAVVVLESTTTLSGKNITLPQGENVKIESHVVEINPGAEIGRHKHPYPVFMYVLEGTLLVEMNDGTEKTYNAGEAFIEDADTWVNNNNPGTGTVKFLAVLPGYKDSTLVIMPDK